MHKLHIRASSECLLTADVASAPEGGPSHFRCCDLGERANAYLMAVSDQALRYEAQLPSHLGPSYIHRPDVETSSDDAPEGSPVAQQ